MDVLIIIMLAVVCGVLVWLGISMKKAGSRRTESDNEERNEYLRRLEDMERRHKMELELMKDNFETQRRDIIEQHQHHIEQLRRDGEARFESLSRKILDEEQQRLREANVQGMESILAPLRARMDEFQRVVTEARESDTRGRANLAGQVEQLMRLNITIGQEARNLTSALKGDSKLQGDWGEHILSTLLEKAGLEEGIHFDTQITRDSFGQVLRSDDGAGLRPDAVIYLPDHRSLIVDSKVSLTAFMDYCNASDDDMRKQAGRRHLESVKKHIRELAEKNYPKVIADAAEHVIMFMPVENAYIVALRLDPSLWNYAYSRKVAIVTPTHLFSTLQIVTQLWTRDDQNRHVAKIAEAGGKLYDKLAIFCRSFEKIDGALSAARTAYDDALRQLATGKGNALRQAEAMKELGAKVQKSIPQKFIDLSDVSDEDHG